MNILLKILIVILIVLVIFLFLPIKYTLRATYESSRLKIVLLILGIKIDLIGGEEKHTEKINTKKKRRKFISPKDFIYLVKVLKKELPGIFKEVKPDSVRTKFNFAPVDLFKAGIVAAILGPIKILTGRDFGIIPSFIGHGLNGSLTITGSPRLIILIISGIRLFTNRRFMNIIK